MQSAVADTTREKKLLEVEVVSDSKAEEKESERLSTLFRKYKINQYFWRNYKNTARLKSLALIVLVTVLEILLAIFIFR